MTEIERVPLGTIASVSAGGTPSRSEPSYWNGTIPWITTSQVDFGVIESASEFITEAGLAGSSAKLFTAGTVVMAMFGQGVTRGKVGILGLDAAFNQACVAIVPTKGDDSRFLYHHLEHDYERIRRLSQAGTQSNLNAEIIKSLPIARFSVDEQAALASIGDRCDYAALLTDRIIDAKRKLLRGLMQQLLTGRRLPAFAGEAWEEVPIGSVMREDDRPVEWNDDELYELVSVRRWAGGVYTRDQLYGRDIKVKKLKRIKSGDVLISHIQSAYGAMAMVSDNHDGHCVSDLYTVLVPQDASRCDPRFFAWLCRTKWMWHQALIASNGFKAERLRINFDPASFLKLMIDMPTSLDEQRAIADILDTAQREIKLLEQLREQIQLQKRGLMQRLLTGEIRVKGGSVAV